MVVADPGEPVLAPVIGARAGLIVREVIPGVAGLTIVLAHRAPLAFAPRPRGIAVGGPIGSIIAAVVGAIILITILRLIKRA